MSLRHRPVFATLAAACAITACAPGAPPQATPGGPNAGQTISAAPLGKSPAARASGAPAAVASASAPEADAAAPDASEPAIADSGDEPRISQETAGILRFEDVSDPEAMDTPRPVGSAVPVAVFTPPGIPVIPSSAPSLRPPAAIAIDPMRELMVRDVGVVEDPVRATGLGPWTFGRLMASLAGKGGDTPAFTLAWLKTWATPRNVGGETIAARPSIQAQIIAPWLAASGGKRLDMAKAPFRLLAIANRLDLRKDKTLNAGEGRFVFGALDANGNPLQFTVIFEFGLPVAAPEDTLKWARRWHRLGTFPLGSEDYRKALHGITNAFSNQGLAPDLPNGSTIHQVRTNEIALGSPWELREFRLPRPAVAGTLVNLRQVTVKQNPRQALNNTAELRDFINANEARLLKDSPTHVVPRSLLGGASPENFQVWNAPGINNPKARRAFAVNTCNGCHTSETGTGFLHVVPRLKGQEAGLSGFLTGIDVADPAGGGAMMHFADLDRRAADLAKLLGAAKVQVGTAAASPRPVPVPVVREEEFVRVH